MNNNYYSRLSEEELVEKNGGTPLPLRTEPAAQFQEMPPEQQQRVVEFQRNQQKVDKGFGNVEICIPSTLYIEAMIGIDSECNPHERAERFIADHILCKFDER